MYNYIDIVYVVELQLYNVRQFAHKDEHFGGPCLERIVQHKVRNEEMVIGSCPRTVVE